MAELKLFTFGPPRLERDGHPIDLNLRKALALLIYLTVTAQPQSRDTLATLLWPDSDQREARGRLRRTLHRLRDELDEDVVISSADMISLDPGAHLWLDSTTFLQHATRGLDMQGAADAAHIEHLQAAAVLYTDDFLAGWAVAESAAFDEWQFFERERLRQSLAQVLEGLVHSFAAQGSWEAAVPYARRWVALDPLHEIAQRQLMTVYAWAGQQAAAVRQYGECARILEAELDVAPDAATTALYDAIRFRRFPPSADGTVPHARQGATPVPSLAANRDPAPSSAASPISGANNTPVGTDVPIPRPFFVPVPPTPLVNRIAELQTICADLRDLHLRAVTIIGTGGIGKTRLAIEAAHALRDDFADGVYFVELASLNDAALVRDAVAQALGVKERPGQSISATLRDFIRSKHILLVLDNFEHVVAESPLVSELLAACPALRVLVTSRAPLNIRAEHQFMLEPLSDAGAVRLFLQRAQAVGASLPTDEANTAIYKAICQRLDRLPLAIELIAVRARTLAPSDLLRQVERPLQSLVHGPRDVPVRHRAMRNAIQWSYDLLDAVEQRVFTGLGVFAGGWTAEAAQVVVGESMEVLSVLENLHQASLVQQQTVAGETRFVMLETIREFALEQLKAQQGHVCTKLTCEHCEGNVNGVQQRAQRPAHRSVFHACPLSVQQRHAAFFLALLEQAESDIPGTQLPYWPQRLKIELPNLRVALQTLIEAQDRLSALRLVAVLWHYWADQGYLNEGRDWLDRALRLADTTNDTTISLAHHEALLGAAFMAFVQDDYTCARQRYEQLFTLAQLSGQQKFTAKALEGLGVVQQCTGHLSAARDLLEQSIISSREVGDECGEHRTLFSLAYVRAQQGEFDAARKLFEQAVAFSRTTANPISLGNALAYYAYAIAHQGDNDDALPRAEEALAICLREDLPWPQQIALQTLGLLAFQAEDLASARALFERALIQSRRLGDRLYISVALSYLGLTDLYESAWEQAYTRLVEALQLAQAIRSPKAISLACEGLAYLWGSTGDWERATQLFGAIEMIYRRRGALPAPLNYKLHMPFVQDAHINLGSQGFALAWCRGQELTVEAACTLASTPIAFHAAGWSERPMLALGQVINHDLELLASVN